VRSFVPVFQALRNNADAALQTNPSRFEKWPLSRIMLIPFLRLIAQGLLRLNTAFFRQVMQSGHLSNASSGFMVLCRT